MTVKYNKYKVYSINIIIKTIVIEIIIIKFLRKERKKI